MICRLEWSTSQNFKEQCDLLCIYGFLAYCSSVYFALKKRACITQTSAVVIPSAWPANGLTAVWSSERLIGYFSLSHTMGFGDDFCNARTF